jgi:hypothetical protein
MPMSFFALDAKQFNTWRKKVAAKQKWDIEQAELAKQPSRPTADDDWSDVLPKKAEPDPDGYLVDHAAEHIEVDWAHFGVSYLMQRAADLPYSLADLVPEVFGDGLGNDGPGVVLDAPKIEIGIQFLSRIDESQLRAAWRPDEMRQLEIWPTTAWGEPDALDTLVETFRDLVGLFERSHREQRVIITQMVI